MSDQTIATTTLDGVLKIERPTFSDDRGFFREPVRIKELGKLGISFNVAQMNHAKSIQKTLRGIHSAPWNKLIYVPNGAVQAVIVDLRIQSHTFGRHESFLLGTDNLSSIFIPKGFGNSYLALSESADYVYLTDQEWEPNKETGIVWNDTDLNIDWIIKEPKLSEKDDKNQTLREAFPDKFS